MLEELLPNLTSGVSIMRSLCELSLSGVSMPTCLICWQMMMILLFLSSRLEMTKLYEAKPKTRSTNNKVQPIFIQLV